MLVDGGRTGLIGGDLQEMLRCIRCGACMNHCPVYQNDRRPRLRLGLSGPDGLGADAEPMSGIDNALDLPQASTLCGECNGVCPVEIPLSDLLRKLREKQMERGLRPWGERAASRVWGCAARRPGLYAMFTKLAARILARMGGNRNG